MAYGYSENTLMRWPIEAQAETYRLKFLHQEQETAHWKRTAASLKAQLDQQQAREQAA